MLPGACPTVVEGAPLAPGAPDGALGAADGAVVTGALTALLGVVVPLLGWVAWSSLLQPDTNAAAKAADAKVNTAMRAVGWELFTRR